MITRISKLLLLVAVACYYAIVVFNNLTDFDSNYEFVRHVLMMDTTFPHNHGMWRAIPSPAWHRTFYISIIGWEIVTCLVLWVGALQLARRLFAPAEQFEMAKRVSIAGLTLSMLMWMFAFLTVGAEWFLMWQSHEWNGQEAAFRMFAITGIVLLLLLQPEQSASSLKDEA
jgi:predicted small integral membrane protein